MGHLKGYKIKICLWKAYFDNGINLTSYFQWIIAYWGITTQDMKSTFIFAVFYALFCFFLGWLWIRKGMYDANNEIANRFNPFVREVRKKLKIK